MDWHSKTGSLDVLADLLETNVVLLRVFLEELGVEGSDSVDSMSADNAQMSHVDAFLAMSVGLLDDRHPTHPVHVP